MSKQVLRMAFTGHQLRITRSVDVGYVEDKLAMGQVFLRLVQLSPVSHFTSTRCLLIRASLTNPISS